MTATVVRSLGESGCQVLTKNSNEYKEMMAMLENADRSVKIKGFDLPSLKYKGESVTIFDRPLKSSMDKELVKTNLDALKAYSKIPGVLQLKQCFETADYVFLFTEPVFQSLRALLTPFHAISTEVRLDAYISLADSLAKIHEAGILHNDLNPDHIYFTDYLLTSPKIAGFDSSCKKDGYCPNIHNLIYSSYDVMTNHATNAVFEKKNDVYNLLMIMLEAEGGREFFVKSDADSEIYLSVKLNLPDLLIGYNHHERMSKEVHKTFINNLIGLAQRAPEPLLKLIVYCLHAELDKRPTASELAAQLRLVAQVISGENSNATYLGKNLEQSQYKISTVETSNGAIKLEGEVETDPSETIGGLMLKLSRKVVV